MKNDRLHFYNQKKSAYNYVRHAIDWAKKDKDSCKGHYCRVRRKIDYRLQNGDPGYWDINPGS